MLGKEKFIKSFFFHSIFNIQFNVLCHITHSKLCHYANSDFLMRFLSGRSCLRFTFLPEKKNSPLLHFRK